MLPGIQSLQRLDAINAGRTLFSSPHASKSQKTCSQAGLISSPGRGLASSHWHHWDGQDWNLWPIHWETRGKEGYVLGSYVTQVLPTARIDQQCWEAIVWSYCGWTRDLVIAVFNYTLRDCFGYAIASFTGYSRLCRKLGKFSHKTVPQCNLTEHQPSLTHNLRIACSILVSSAALLFFFFLIIYLNINIL